MGAWTWRRGEPPRDVRAPTALLEGRPRVPREPTDGVVPPVAEPAARMRLGVDVLPEQGRPARRLPLVAPGAAPAVEPPVGSSTEAADTSSAPGADLHVRRAIALAELSLLAHDQD